MKITALWEKRWAELSKRLKGRLRQPSHDTFLLPHELHRERQRRFLRRLRRLPTKAEVKQGAKWPRYQSAPHI